MPKIQNWKTLESFESKLLIDTFYRSNKKTSTTQTVQRVCSVCDPNTNGHTMIYRIRKCASVKCAKMEPCKFKYLELTCRMNFTTHISSLYSHNRTDDVEVESDDHYGIHELVKKQIENIIHERGYLYPLKIEMALKKLDIIPELMPSITQIKSFIKRRRVQLGDNNNIEGVQEFIDNQQLTEDLDVNKLFFFVNKLFFPSTVQPNVNLTNSSEIQCNSQCNAMPENL